MRRAFGLAGLRGSAHCAGEGREEEAGPGHPRRIGAKGITRDLPPGRAVFA
jgi:hypothetical protein